MTDLKFKLLEMLYNASPIYPLKERDLLNSGHSTMVKIDYAIKDLITLNYIEQPVCSDTVKITSPGRNAYESEKENRDQQAKQEAEKHADQLAMMSLSEVQRKKQFRHDFVISTFSAILGAGFTLLVEHFPQLVNAILSLFK